MAHKAEMILKTVHSSREKDVNTYFEKHGFVLTLLYLVEYIWDKETIDRAAATVENRDKTSNLYKLLFEEFNIEEHFRITDSHRHWVQKSYHRLRDFFSCVTEEDIKVHDLSKYNFVQAMGYTAKWVHHVEWTNIVWQRAQQDHYKKESHHPVFRKGQRMEPKDLEQSFIDMVACRWERQLGGREDVSNADLMNVDEKFLLRYEPEDQVEIKLLIQKIKDTV